jgi:BirA family transcriptional regulator, biotin operon repressor / biotin---[acetyl-CoA-carboxylase] ligase
VRLPPHLVAGGDALQVFDTIDSTMDEARRRLACGINHRLWIVADEQTAGRGRQGRVWVSPPGNLHMTALIHTQTPPRDQPKIGFAAGAALARTARELLPHRIDVALKWPNDLLVAGGKASGLLLEGLGGGAVAIGIGINIVAHPPETPYPATHLAAHVPGLDKHAVFEKLSAALVEELDAFADGRGFALTRQRWLGFAAHQGRRVSVRQDGLTLDGVFRDIDADGRLVLATDAGEARIAAGDVFPLDK